MAAKLENWKIKYLQPAMEFAKESYPEQEAFVAKAWKRLENAKKRGSFSYATRQRFIEELENAMRWENKISLPVKVSLEIATEMLLADLRSR